MWFSASVFFENVHLGQPPEENLWEDRLFLIQADSEEMAQEKARSLGKAQEFEHTAALGDRVRCEFRAVESVCEIDGDSFENGTELFTRFLKSTEARSVMGSMAGGEKTSQAKSA